MNRGNNDPPPPPNTYTLTRTEATLTPPNTWTWTEATLTPQHIHMYMKQRQHSLLPHLLHMDMNRGNIDPPNIWILTEATLIVLTHGQERRQHWPPSHVKTYTLIWAEAKMTPDHIHIDMNIGNIDGPSTWAWTRATLTLPTYEHEQRQHWYPPTYEHEQRQHWPSPNIYTWRCTEATMTHLPTSLRHTRGHEQRQHWHPLAYTRTWTEATLTPQHMDMKSSKIDTPKKNIHILWFMTRLVIHAYHVGEPLVSNTVYDL